MNERVVWAEIPSVAALVRLLPWANTATYMYLERVPSVWLDAAARQNGVQLQRYAAETVFDTWERGRIFDAEQELKWEQRPQGFHAVYCGLHPPDAWAMVGLYSAYHKEQTYYLWGRSVQASDRELLGLDAETPAFVELQIPRILQYPAPTSQERVRVNIREFYTTDGQLCYARWCGLQ
jgi:hypothetical protein